MDESVHKLNKHWEAVNSNKQFQNEGLRNERMRGSHLSNMGSQTHQSTTELANKKLEDVPNKIIPNTHISTSAVEIQVSRHFKIIVAFPLLKLWVYAMLIASYLFIFKL